MSSESEEKTNKAKIIVLSIFLAVVVVFIIVFATIMIIKVQKANQPDPPAEEQIIEPEEPSEPEKPTVFSNSYNESISRHILSDDGYAYKGTYKFDSVGQLYYNLKSDSNPNGFTNADIQKFWNNNDCKDGNSFRLKVITEKNTLLANSTLKIEQRIDDNTGTNIPYGEYENTLTDSHTNGKVYGDCNLAVLLRDNSNDKDYQFMSLNYKKFDDAIAVSETTQTDNGTLYVFDNYYKDGKLLYTLTFIYKKV